MTTRTPSHPATGSDDGARSIYNSMDGEAGNGEPLFPLGRTVATPAALALLARFGKTPIEYLGRHARGDWSEMCEEDREKNRLALEQGFQVFSAYRLPHGYRLWVITEADRSVTTILLPSDY
jgi:hypothetical protein